MNFQHTKNMEHYYNKKVVVTGGAGFIGSHLVENLVSAGAQVTVIDNLSTGSLDNIACVTNAIRFINFDITDAQSCKDALHTIDYVFHLAAFISVPQSFEAPELCHATNVTGTFNMLEASRINNIKRFVFSSSCAVYGNYDQPACEKTVTAPTSPYGYSKLLGELYCKSYSAVYQLPTTILRYYNVVGPRQNPSGDYAGVYAKFSYNMQNNLPITIFGDGKQIRDFVPVEEVVQANLLGARLPVQHGITTTINVATGKPDSILDLYKKLKNSHPAYSLEPIFKEKRTGDVPVSIGNCNRYQKIIKEFL